MHTITLLGSTGSIGRQTLDVVSRHPERFRVVHMAAGSNVDLANEQIRTFSPKSFVIGDASKRDALTGAEILTGEEALLRISSDDIQELGRASPEVLEILHSHIALREAETARRLTAGGMLI